jgi:hypothetical protein
MAKKSSAVEAREAEVASNRAVAEKEIERKALAKAFKTQDTAPVQVSPLYAPYFGKVMTVTINGISVAVPCDGKTYMVPASFAEEVLIRLNNQDELIQKKRKLGDVSNNFETSPGELQIF